MIQLDKMHHHKSVQYINLTICLNIYLSLHGSCLQASLTWLTLLTRTKIITIQVGSLRETHLYVSCFLDQCLYSTHSLVRIKIIN